MARRLLEHDPDTGITEWFVEEADGTFWIEQVQECDAILESNKRQYADVDERARLGGEMVKFASLPMSVWHEMKKKGILNDQKALRRFFRDPDNRFFLTRPIKL